MNLQDDAQAQVLPTIHGHVSHGLYGFFSIAVAALQHEDLQIRRALGPFHEGAYANWSRGVSALYETAIVYTVIRALWDAGYPHAVGWEVNYGSHWPSAKADLGIFAEPPEASIARSRPHSVIEFKWWMSGQRKQELALWSDVLKLLWFSGASNRYLMLLSMGPRLHDLGADVAWLTRGGAARGASNGEMIANIVRQFPATMMWTRPHFGGIVEELWSEFDTDSRAVRGEAKIRVSLIRVKGHGRLGNLADEV